MVKLLVTCKALHWAATITPLHYDKSVKVLRVTREGLIEIEADPDSLKERYRGLTIVEPAEHATKEPEPQTP